MKTLEKRMKALDKRMMKFGKSLEGRLDARLIESALDYIHYSERFWLLTSCVLISKISISG